MNLHTTRPTFWRIKGEARPVVEASVEVETSLEDVPSHAQGLLATIVGSLVTRNRNVEISNETREMGSSNRI